MAKEDIAIPLYASTVDRFWKATRGSKCLFRGFQGLPVALDKGIIQFLTVFHKHPVGFQHIQLWVRIYNGGKGYHSDYLIPAAVTGGI